MAKQQKASIGSSIDLAPTRHQPITDTTDNQAYWHI